MDNDSPLMAAARKMRSATPDAPPPESPLAAAARQLRSPAQSPLAQAAQTLAAQRPTGGPPPSPKVETPKDVRANPWRDFGDAAEADFAAANAWLRSDPKLYKDLAGHGDHTDFKKAVDLLRQEKFHDVSEEYGVGTVPQLKSEAARGDRLSQAQLDHPLLNAVVTGATEFANPANILTGEVAGQALRYGGLGVKAARAASPVLHDSLTGLEQAGAAAAKPFVTAAGAVARPIGKALAPVTNAIGKANAAAQGVARQATAPVSKILNSFFSKYGDIENAAGTQVGDVARAVDKRPAIVRKAVEKLTGQVFGKDLTREQKIEVWRRSTVDDRNNRLHRDNTVPEPTKGLSLDDRADLYRGAYNRITPLLQRFGLLKDETRPTGQYDPRKRYNGRPILVGDDVDDTTQPFVPVRAMKLDATGAGGAGRLGVRKFNAKRYDDRLPHEIPNDKLHPDFDPAHQFFYDLLAKHTSLSNEIGKGRFERVYPVKDGNFITDPQFGQPVAARTPTKYANDDTGEFFGYGAEGEKALEKNMRERADVHATSLAVNDFTVRRDAKALQVTPEEIASARGLKARIFGAQREIVQASKARQTSGNLADYVTRRYTAQKDRIGTELFTAATRQARRVDSLNDALDKAQATATQGAGMARARQFATMVDERDRETQRLTGVIERVERAASPVGLSAKSGYETAFNLVDALPKQLAAKVRPLLEGAGETPNAQSLTAARAMLKSANTPEAQALDTELHRLATRTTTGKLDGLRDSIDAIRFPDAEKGLAGIERANARRGASLTTSLDTAISKSAGIQAALKSANADEVAAAKDLVQRLKDADALRVNRPNITDNAEVDAYLFDAAQDRGKRPAYMERFVDTEDAAGNYVRTVRTSGNAQQSRETAGYDFTAADVTHARKFMAQHLAKVPSRQAVLDHLQKAMQFDQSRKGDLASLVEEYGSMPEAVRTLSGALRYRMGETQKGAGAIEGAADAAKPFTEASTKIRADSGKFDAQLADRAQQIRQATPGGGYSHAMKRLAAIARAAEEAPAKASAAATSGALESQATSMARAARAGVDDTGQRIIGDLHREAQAAERDVARVWDDIYGKRDRLARPSEDAMYAAQGKALSASIREKMLREKKATLEELARARENYDRVYQQHFDNMLSHLRGEYRDAEQAPAGYVKEESGSPTGKDKWLLREVSDFLNQNGKTPAAAGDAKAATDAFARFNAIARAGVVWLPLAHAGPNLGLAFLKTGGTPQRMGQILLTQAKFDRSLVARAEKAGATSEATSVMFHDTGAHEAFTPTADLAKEAATKAGRFGKVASAATYVKAGADHVYSGMNNWLFDKVERGYRIDYFDRLTQRGMSDGEAARAVNAAFGKVGDFSQHERKWMLDKIFYFYPWMKTVIPFWIKHGLIDPQWVDAPVRGIQVANEQQGYDDPSRPFTATAGKRDDGSWRRYKLFVPQSVNEMTAEAARLPYDAATGNLQGALGDIGAPLTYAQGHLNTFLSIGEDLVSAAVAYRTHQRPSPYNTFAVDPTQSPAQAGAAMAGKLAGRAFSPIEQGVRAVTDPASIFTIPAGGFVYGVKPEEQKKLEARVADRYGHDIAAAKKRHDAIGLAKLYAQRAATIKAYESPATPRPSPSPGLGALYPPR